VAARLLGDRVSSAKGYSMGFTLGVDQSPFRLTVPPAAPTRRTP